MGERREIGRDWVEETSRARDERARRRTGRRLGARDEVETPNTRRIRRRVRGVQNGRKRRGRRPSLSRGATPSGRSGNKTIPGEIRAQKERKWKREMDFNTETRWVYRERRTEIREGSVSHRRATKYE